MSKRSRWVRIACAVFLVLLLAMPTIQWAARLFPEGSLYGYVDAVPGRPIHPLGAFFGKTLQPWAKEYFDVNLGFRPYLIRTFNEIHFALFRENNRKTVISTSGHGLHSHLGIDYLNAEVKDKAEMENRYRSEAQKMLRAQRAIEARGKYFVVVIATSKTYAYPEELGRRYLVAEGGDILSRAASFGDALKAAEVNVIDSGPVLRKFARDSGVETHPEPGLHWNFYAGCLIARRVLDDARERRFSATPPFDCGKPVYDYRRHMIDFDGLNLLNVWSHGGLKKTSPYPSIVPVKEAAWLPKIVFIGDSFSYQLRMALQQGGVYSKLVMSSYFALRDVDGPAAAGEKPPAAPTIRDQLIEDVLASDIIIVEMADYNVKRFGYGFADYVADKLK